MKTTHVFVDFENVQPEGLALLKAQPAFHVLVFVGSTQKTVSVENLVLPLQDLGERGRIIKVTGSGHNALDFHIAFKLGQMSEREPDASFRIISKDKGFDPLVCYLTDLGRDVARHDSVHFILGLAVPGGKAAESTAAAKPAAELGLTAAAIGSTCVTTPETQAAAKPIPVPTPRPVLLKPAAVTKLAKPTAKVTRAKSTHTVKPTREPKRATPFHVAYQAVLTKPKVTHPGTLAKLKNDIRSKNPDATVADTESVVKRLQEQGIIAIDPAGKVTYLATPPSTAPSSAGPSRPELCRNLIDKLDARKNPKATRPSTRKALASFIKSTYPKQSLTSAEIGALILAMEDARFIAIAPSGAITWSPARDTR